MKVGIPDKLLGIGVQAPPLQSVRSCEADWRQEGEIVLPEGAYAVGVSSLRERGCRGYQHI